MQVYHFDSETREYVGSSRSPHLPQSATLISPPPTDANQTAVWSPSDELWRLTDDFRGQAIWRKSSMETGEVDYLGPVPDEWTLANPDDVDVNERRAGWLAFDETVGHWRIDIRKKTQVLFAEALQRIEAEHDRRIAAGCTYDGLVFGATGEARRLLQEIISGNQWPHTWFDRDFLNPYPLNDSAQAGQLLAAMQAFVAPIKQVRYRKVSELAALRAKNDPDLISSYDITAGWPESAI